MSVFSVPIATHDDLNAFLASDTPKDVEVAADGTVLSVTETTKEALLNKYVPNWRTRIDISVGACSSEDMCISSIYGGTYAARNVGTRYVNYPNTSGIFLASGLAKLGRATFRLLADWVLGQANSFRRGRRWQLVKLLFMGEIWIVDMCELRGCVI